VAKWSTKWPQGIFYKEPSIPSDLAPFNLNYKAIVFFPLFTPPKGFRELKTFT
jgi:hypothetical protein